jgi:hypothetical protein
MTVLADEIRVGDRVIGPAGQQTYVYPIDVIHITDYNRNGERLGPRLHSERYARVDLTGARRMVIERG